MTEPVIEQLISWSIDWGICFPNEPKKSPLPLFSKGGTTSSVGISETVEKTVTKSILALLPNLFWRACDTRRAYDAVPKTEIRRWAVSGLIQGLAATGFQRHKMACFVRRHLRHAFRFAGAMQEQIWHSHSWLN